MLDTSENVKPMEFEADEEASRVFTKSTIRGASSAKTQSWQPQYKETFALGF